MAIDDPVRIPSKFDAVQAARAISGEEAWGKIFVKNSIEDYEGVPCNLPTFEYYIRDDRDYPTLCKIKLRNDEAPPNYDVQWKGPMLLSNERCEVILYRQREK